MRARLNLLLTRLFIQNIIVLVMCTLVGLLSTKLIVHLYGTYINCPIFIKILHSLFLPTISISIRVGIKIYLFNSKEIYILPLWRKHVVFRQEIFSIKTGCAILISVILRFLFFMVQLNVKFLEIVNLSTVNILCFLFLWLIEIVLPIFLFTSLELESNGLGVTIRNLPFTSLIVSNLPFTLWSVLPFYSWSDTKIKFSPSISPPRDSTSLPPITPSELDRLHEGRVFPSPSPPSSPPPSPTSPSPPSPISPLFSSPLFSDPPALPSNPATSPTTSPTMPSDTSDVTDSGVTDSEYDTDDSYIQESYRVYKKCSRQAKKTNTVTDSIKLREAGAKFDWDRANHKANYGTPEDMLIARELEEKWKEAKKKSPWEEACCNYEAASNKAKTTGNYSDEYEAKKLGERLDEFNTDEDSTDGANTD